MTTSVVPKRWVCLVKAISGYFQMYTYYAVCWFLTPFVGSNEQSRVLTSVRGSWGSGNGLPIIRAEITDLVSLQTSSILCQYQLNGDNNDPMKSRCSSEIETLFADDFFLAGQEDQDGLFFDSFNGWPRIAHHSFNFWSFYWPLSCTSCCGGQQQQQLLTENLQLISKCVVYWLGHTICHHRIFGGQNITADINSS